MKYNTITGTFEYEKIRERLQNCFAILNSEYVSSIQSSYTAQKPFFTFSIIKILLENHDLLGYFSIDCKKKLINALKLFSYKYIKTLEQRSFPSEIIMIFQSYVSNILNYLTISLREPLKIYERNDKLKFIKNLANDFGNQCYMLFLELANNQDLLNKLQATYITLYIKNLSIKQHNAFINRLLMIRELWQFDVNFFLTKNIPPILLNNNIQQILSRTNLENLEVSFREIVEWLVDGYNVLPYLTNGKLLSLYNRLKEYNLENPIIYYLLEQLHQEASFRHNRERLNDSGYELIKLFESYNSLLQQIEQIEYTIVELSLFNHYVFFQGILVALSKHIDTIRVVTAYESTYLKDILTYIKDKLFEDLKNNRNIASLISSIQLKLGKNLEPNIAKRYVGLDAFMLSAIKTKYNNLFKNILIVLNKDVGYDQFVQHTLVHRIARYYQVNNPPTSIKKRRLIIKERHEIIKKLSEINFLEIFHNKFPNNISRLNFKKNITKHNASVPSTYVAAIIRILLEGFTVEQLDSILCSLTRGNLVTIKDIVTQELNNQITKRTNIIQTIYYICTGRRHELLKLHSIKQALESLE